MAKCKTCGRFFSKKCGNCNREGCKGSTAGNPNIGYDYDCGYNTFIACEDCMYGPYKKGRDPSAECNKIT